MRFCVLGPLAVTDDDGRPVDLGGRQPRVVVAALVAAGGRPIGVDALVEAVWGDEPPRSASGTLQTYVSRLRRTFGDSPRLVLEPAGYRLDLADHEVDLVAFERLAAEGEAQRAAGRPAEARDALAAALALWRGPALPELAEHGTGVGRSAALDERRLAVLEERIEVDLALGRHAHVIGELHALVADHPLREGLHAKLALALYRSGRQADALRALAAASTVLREELGLEPGARLTDLEAAILTHDPSLDGPAPAAPPAGPHDAGARPQLEPASAGPEPDRAGGDAPIPLVARTAELAELLAAFGEARADARFVVVEGEPGIGKTRLVDELASTAAARGSLVAWGRSNEGGAAPALWPWLPVLRAAAGFLADDVPGGLIDVLDGEAPLVAGQGAAVQFERFDAIAEVLERAGKERPAVVCLDDLQWADPASLALLEFLATRLTQGVLVVATLRTLGLGHVGPVTDALGALARRPGSRRVRLRGLAPDATDELLAAVARSELAPGLSARIHDRAEGNPFYAIELARLLADGAPAGEVPASVRDAIRRRLGRLPEATVELLTLAAVAGRDLDVALVARAAGLDVVSCLEGLDPAAEHRLLEPSPGAPGGLRFSHALVREVLADELTPLRRARLHLRIADAITGAAGGDEAVDRDRAEVLAAHLAEAVPLGVGDRAAAALERAAETAISRVAYVQAEELLERAARLRRVGGSSADAKRAELATLLRLLEVMQATRYFAGTDRHVLRRAQQLAAELGDEDVVRKMAWSDWAALSTADHLVECRPMAEAYLARWGDDPRPRVSAAAHVMMGVDEWTWGRIDAALEHLDRALGLLEGQPPPADAFEGEYQVVAHAFSLYSHAAAGHTTPEEALAGFELLLAVVPPAAVPAVCAFAGAVALAHTRWDDLDRLVRRAFDADPSAQFAFFGGQLLMQRAIVLAASGELDAGVAAFVDGRTRYRAVGGQSTIGTYQALLAELLARAGRVAEGAELVSGARRHFDDVGGGNDEVTLLIAEGVVAALGGAADRAAERLAAAVDTGHRTGAHALARRAEAVAAELSVVPDHGAR